MDYERDTTLSNMYFGTEVRFDGIPNGFAWLVAKLTHRPVGTERKPAVA